MLTIPDKRESLPVTPTMRRVANSFASDDEPLYDSVASDEDYSSVDNLSLQNLKADLAMNNNNIQDTQPAHEVSEFNSLPDDRF